MIYPYHCIKCGRDIDIVKPHQEAAREEICPDCSITLDRVWTAPQLAPITVEPYYDHALGRRVSSKRDIKDAQREYHDRTGSELVEIGTDKPKVKPKTQSYDLPREVMAQIEAA